MMQAELSQEKQLRLFKERKKHHRLHVKAVIKRMTFLSARFSGSLMHSRC